MRAQDGEEDKESENEEMQKKRACQKMASISIIPMITENTICLDII